jgi:hypothetical protein
VELFCEVIQQQHTPAINLIEAKLVDYMEGLPLALLLKLLYIFVLVNLVDPFFNILVTVV